MAGLAPILKLKEPYTAENLAHGQRRPVRVTLADYEPLADVLRDHHPTGDQRRHQVLLRGAQNLLRRPQREAPEKSVSLDKRELKAMSLIAFATRKPNSRAPRGIDGYRCAPRSAAWHGSPTGRASAARSTIPAILLLRFANRTSRSSRRRASPSGPKK